MSIDFSTIKSITIPEGKVIKITRTDDMSVLWNNSSVTLPKALSTLSTGSSVYLNVDGVSTEFLVVQQDLPSSDYDSSCDGT